MEDPVEHRADLLLRSGEAGHFGIGRVGEEQVDSFFTQPSEGTQVGHPTVKRELIHLEVAGVQDHPGAGADGDGQCVWDRVVDCDELKIEGSKTDPIAFAHDIVDGVFQPVLAQF